MHHTSRGRAPGHLSAVLGSEPRPSAGGVTRPTGNSTYSRHAPKEPSMEARLPSIVTSRQCAKACMSTPRCSDGPTIDDGRATACSMWLSAASVNGSDAVAPVDDAAISAFYHPGCPTDLDQALGQGLSFSKGSPVGCSGQTKRRLLRPTPSGSV